MTMISSSPQCRYDDDSGDVAMGEIISGSSCSIRPLRQHQQHRSVTVVRRWMSPASSSSSKPLSLHHRYLQGIVVVVFILISESLTVVNAISFWNQFVPQPRFASSSSSSTPTSDCTTTTTGTSSSNTCSSSSSTGSNSCHHKNQVHLIKSTRHEEQEECFHGPPSQPYWFWTRNIFQNALPTISKKSRNINILTVPRCGGEMVDAATTATGAGLAPITPFHIPLHVWKILFQSFLTLINVICWYVPLKIHTHQQRKVLQPLQKAVTSTKTHSETIHDTNAVDPITPNTTSVVATASTSSSSIVQDQNEQNQFILSMANAFSGGVFLSLAFGHLIPECVHGFLDVISNSDTTTSSSHHHHNMETVPYLCVLCGYLIIFFVEKVAFSNTHDLLLHPEHHYHPPPAGPLRNEENHHHSHPYMNGSSHTTSVSSPTTEAATTTSALATGRSALILLGALAVHSILEMMALGLADTFRDCALLTISISLHQPAESIALLVAFIKSGLSESQIILFLSIFSCMGMIGVLTGMIVNEYAAPIVDSIMLAIVAGTFVYVGATEIIPEEFESSQYKWKKFMALFSGIATILCITQYTATLGGGH